MPRKKAAKTAKPKKSPEISDKWRKLLKLIPGYDAIGTAPAGYWFDEDAADRAIEFFQGDDDGPGLLYHVKGHKGGEPFALEPWQQALTGCIFGWKTPEGMRRYREVWLYVPRKNGKQLALDTPILTLNGWTTMGELRVGDIVFDDRRQVCTVRYLSPVDPLPVSYEIVFSNGDAIKACADHQWKTTLTGIRTTQELYEATWLNHFIATPDSPYNVRIEGIMPCEPVPMRCIGVDSPSHLYLAGKTMIPTHNSPWASGVVLLIMMTDPEAGIEAYSAASDRDQASLVYQYAYGMIKSEPVLERELKVYKALKSIEYEKRFATYKVLSGIPESKHGLNVHLGVIDETHAHKTADLIEVIMTGTAARKQPLIIHTTTADYIRESICNEKYEYACNVRDRVTDDPGFLPVIYEATPPEDEEKDPLWWTREKAWQQANPNLGVSVELDYLRRESQRALENPRLRNTFLRLHMNIRTGQDTAWFGIDKWDACYDAELALTDLEGEPCFGGLDLASVSDLCALSLWFYEKKAVFTWFWLPLDTAKDRADKAGLSYPQWIEQGYIAATPGNVADYDQIRLAISGCTPFGTKRGDGLVDRFNIREIAIDRWNATQITTQLMGDGIEMVPFGQGFGSMNAPSKELERLIIGKELRHNGNPVLRWQASHIAVETDAAGNLKPSKKHSDQKIDGLVALIMAIGRSLDDEGESGPSVYETRGLIRV